MIPVKNNEKKLPPDITSLFPGPDGLYYFIREDAYCRRPLNVSGIGLDPPDYCPEGGDLRELLGCNIFFYPPEVDDLCNNPLIDNAFLAPDNKTAYLFRGKEIWLLHNLPNNPKAAPSKCNLTKHTDATELWNKFHPKSDALFIIQEPQKKPLLVQFHRHKFTVWHFNGGNPVFENFIREMPLNENKYKIEQMFTEKPIEAPIESRTQPLGEIVYEENEFINLCKDPTIDSADSSLDGTLVYLFKNDSYYVLSGIKENGFGKLIKFGKTNEMFDKFSLNSSAVMTCKEGRNRGYVYQFNTLYDINNNITDKANTKFTTWNIDGEITTINEEWIEPSAAGIAAVFHNRNITDPEMIALRDDEVFYYSTVADTFATKRRSVKHYDSKEKLPSGVTAAFSMPNQIIYLFKNNFYCVRELFYNKQPLYCPEWRDSRELFGCYGDPHQKQKSKPKGLNNFKAMKDLCSDLNIDDADQTWQREDMILVWRTEQFWRLADFPFAPRVVETGVSASKWEGFIDGPDAVAIIQEGKIRRGWFYVMYDHYWSSWYPDRKPWVGYKAYWNQPANSEKFGAMMHNGDIKNPLVLGFDGSDVHYYSSDGSILIPKGKDKVSDTDEHWPSDVTAAFRMGNKSVYLFRGDKYCQREWNCSNIKTSCCKKWSATKNLFKCDSFENYSIDGSDSVYDEDYSGNGSPLETTTVDNSSEEVTTVRNEPPQDSVNESDDGNQDVVKKEEIISETQLELETTEEPVTTELVKKPLEKVKDKQTNRVKPLNILPTPRSADVLE